MELGFRIPIVNGIPDSLSVFWFAKLRITDSTSKNVLDSGLHKQNLSESGIRIPLHRAIFSIISNIVQAYRLRKPFLRTRFGACEPLKTILTEFGKLIWYVGAVYCSTNVPTREDYTVICLPVNPTQFGQTVGVFSTIECDKYHKRFSY